MRCLRAASSASSSNLTHIQEKSLRKTFLGGYRQDINVCYSWFGAGFVSLLAFQVPLLALSSSTDNDMVTMAPTLLLNSLRRRWPIVTFMEWLLFSPVLRKTATRQTVCFRIHQHSPVYSEHSDILSQLLLRVLLI
ncbi:hypothetical protein BASA60_010247 [Batrachochytrium salamandrivorans]|nr:hypothetical protein BASA60_010247 [Batrachochytrium salamandrivorans]